MERLSRKPLQGVTNIIRFNWHYYVIAFALIGILFFTQQFIPGSFSTFAFIIGTMALLGIFTSLITSWYVYDRSDLYTLNWLNNLNMKGAKKLVNINAGFDETSSILKEKFPGSQLLVLDFYDPLKHTEISIERARKRYPAFPGTQIISTDSVPLKKNSADHIFLILAAHEIRHQTERIKFFTQLSNSLTDDGRIVVVEHQRDLVNFIAYNFGFFHFHSHAAWKKTFSEAGLSQLSEIKITPFISTFILKKNDTAS